MKTNIINIILVFLFCFNATIFSCTPTCDETELIKLIPQRVIKDLEATQTIDEKIVHYTVEQRNCVENLILNLLRMALLYPNGKIRPGVKEKILDYSPTLSTFLTSYSATDLVSGSPELDREWLNVTMGIRNVTYVHGNREVRSSIDNILGVMEGLMPESKTSKHFDRLSKLQELCKYLSTDSLKISWNAKKTIENHQDIKLKFTPRKKVMGRKHENVILYIGLHHVSIRHGNEYAA